MIRVLFAGRKRVSAELLETIAKDGRFTIVGVLTDNHLPVSPTSDVAREIGLPILNFKEVVQAESALAFDLIISVLYWRKLPVSLINRAPLGAINFHPAPLPEYKGCAGYNLAILHGRHDWGVTAHYMVEGIDEGGIIEVASFPIDYDRETAQSLERTSLNHLRDQVLRVVDQVAHARAMLPTQPNVGGRYVSRAEMEAMKKILPGDDVPRKVRAFWFPPYHGAYIEMNGERFTLVSQPILMDLAEPSSSSLFLDPDYRNES